MLGNVIKSHDPRGRGVDPLDGPNSLGKQGSKSMLPQKKDS